MTEFRSVTATMQPVSRGLRAYFAPVQREDGSPAIFDPAKHAAFDLDVPPVPWLDAGWVDGFKRSSETKVEALRSGKRGAADTQFRSHLGARVDFEFRHWGKLQMALAAGSEHINVLESEATGVDAPCGGAPIGAANVLSGSTSGEIRLNAAGLARFAAGDMVAVDVDYQQQIGYLGSGIAAGYSRDANELPQQPDYIRRITFNVARVKGKTDTSLMLDAPLLGGDPINGAGIQKVVGFVDREGGKFFQEWSALFVLPEVSGGRICFYYPRLQATGAPAEADLDLGGALKLNSLRARFIAMPHTDDLDNEPVLCYRTYIPAANAKLF